MSDPAFRLRHGAEFPYDMPADRSDDWAVIAARGVLADLCDRRGIKRGFDEIDEDVRKEIVATLATIIHEAHGTAPSDLPDPHPSTKEPT